MSRTSIAALLLFGAVIVFFFTRDPGTTQKLQGSIYGLLTPFLKSGSGFERQITQVRSGLKTLEELEKENAQLKVDNRALRASNEALNDVEREANRLRKALNYRERSPFRLVPAQVVTRDASTWWQSITINRGKDDGIEADMPVLTDEGLVGKTTTVSNDLAVVLLISDENCRVAAKVEGTREQGIASGERVQGNIAPMLLLNFLSKQANLQPAQKVYTSGVGGVFPSGLLVGAVQSYRVRELDGQARLAPAVDISQLEDVFVVIGRK